MAPGPGRLIDFPALGVSLSGDRPEAILVGETYQLSPVHDVGISSSHLIIHQDLVGVISMTICTGRKAAVRRNCNQGWDGAKKNLSDSPVHRYLKALRSQALIAVVLGRVDFRREELDSRPPAGNLDRIKGVGDLGLARLYLAALSGMIRSPDNQGVDHGEPLDLPDPGREALQGPSCHPGFSLWAAPPPESLPVVFHGPCWRLKGLHHPPALS